MARIVYSPYPTILECTTAEEEVESILSVDEENY
jgi:hypothetical protein